MITPNSNTKVCGMVMQCIVEYQKNNHQKLPIVIEIGTSYGEGILRYAGFCKKVIGVDGMLYWVPDIISYEKEDIGEVNQEKLKAFNENTQKKNFNVELVIGSSLWKETVDEVKGILAGEKADILLIDGVHTPKEAVQRDFDLYSPLVNVGGFIIFDDCQKSEIAAVCDAVKENNDYELYEDYRVGAQCHMAFKKVR